MTTLTEKQTEALTVIEESGATTGKEMAALIGQNLSNARRTMRKLVAMGRVVEVSKDLYDFPEADETVSEPVASDVATTKGAAPKMRKTRSMMPGSRKSNFSPAGLTGTRVMDAKVMLADGTEVTGRYDYGDPDTGYRKHKGVDVYFVAPDGAFRKVDPRKSGKGYTAGVVDGVMTVQFAQ